MVSQVPSIPQSAFADSSLCTREPSLLPGTEPAWVLLPGAVAQYDSEGTPPHSLGWFEKIIWISAALGCGRDPAWGAKKVGEKLSFSPRVRGGVT